MRAVFAAALSVLSAAGESPDRLSPLISVPRVPARAAITVTASPTDAQRSAGRDAGATDMQQQLLIVEYRPQFD